MNSIENTTAPSGAAAAHSSRVHEDPAKLREAAKQFEALLLGQMLKSRRESSAGGGMGAEDDQAGSSLIEMAEQQFAQVLASQGGLGLAHLVVAGLEKKR